MVFDAHDRGIRAVKGLRARALRNMKTAWRRYSVQGSPLQAPLLQMCSHYLMKKTVACTPAFGWRRVRSRQVGLVRERFFTPRLRFKTYDEMNAGLTDRSVHSPYAKVIAIRELSQQTIWEVFEAERASSFSYAGRVRWIPAVRHRSRRDLPGCALRNKQVLSSCQRGRASVRSTPCGPPA